MKYSMKRVLKSGRFVLLGSLALGAAGSGCSSDDDPAEPGDGDGDGDGDAGDGDGDSGDGDGDSGDGDGALGGAGGGDGDGDGAEPGATSWVAGGWIETADSWYGVLGVVDDLSKGNTLDLNDVVSFDGDFTYTGFGGAIYVGLQEDPRIEKWIVNSAGKLELADELSFMAYGVQETFGGSHNVIQVIDEQTAWFFDHANGRALYFNPSNMSANGTTIDYSEIYDRLDLDADWPDIGDIGRVGEYLAVPMFWYSGADDTIPVETRVALISTLDESVTIAKDTRCAGSSVMSNDSAGNLYIGPHAAAALYSAAGDAGDAVPCIIRIKNGESEIDQDYLISLNELSDGKAVGGLYQGPGNYGFVFQFEGDPTLGARARFEDEWTLYRIDLGAENPTYTEVEGWPQGNGTAQAFSLQVGSETKHYLTSTTEYGAASAYYELLPDGSIQEALQFPTYPGIAVNH